MPRVPSRDSFDVAAGVGPNSRFDTSSVGRESVAPQQMQQFGQQVSQSAKQLGKLHMDAVREANELRVNDALNQLRQRSLELTYSPENGYAALKGQNALERPDGVSLVEEYDTLLGQDISSITEGLSNDHQRMLFDKQAAALRNSFNSDLERHQLGEFTTYHSSVADGALKLSQQEAEMHWNDPDRIDVAINGIEDEEGNRMGGIKQAIAQKARLTGMSDLEMAAELRTAESKVHARVVETALVNGNPVYAEEYFNQHKKGMTGTDILTVQKTLTDEVEANRARIAVNSATQEAATAFLPNDFARLENIVMEMESGGKRYDAEGNLTESSKGALGEMQVLPTTSKDPGYGVTPAQDDSPEELARVGRDYLTAMLREFGNVEQALAAYNAGPASVTEAIDKADATGDPNSWLAHLPKETQNYVVKGSEKFAAGGGAAAMPTKMDFVNRAVAKLGEGASASERTKARELAEKQYKLITEARDQNADNALAEAQKLLVENNGSISDLPADVRMNLLKFDPSKLKEANDFAKAVRETEATQTDEVTYLNVQLNRSQLANLSDAQFQQLLLTKFAPKDRDDVIKLRREQIEGGSDSVETLNNTALNEALKGRLQSIGLDPKSKDEKDIVKVSNVMRFIRDDLYTIQKSTGHKLSPQDIESRIDQLFATEVDIRQTLFGRDGLYPDTTKAILELTIDDMSNEEVTRVKQSLQRKGVMNPSDTLIENTYRKYRMLRTTKQEAYK